MYHFAALIDQFRIMPHYDIYILCYHSIDNDPWRYSVSLSSFSDQLAYLSLHYDFWSMNELVSYLSSPSHLTSSKIIITFDDGYQSLLLALPLLNQYRIKPTVFALSPTHVSNKAELGNHKPKLNYVELKQLVKQGWTIGSHTLTHPNLTTLSAAAQKREILTSQASLSQGLGLPCRYFSYPKGKYNRSILKLVSSNYDLAFSMDDGFISRSPNRYAIPRIGVDGSHTLAEFRCLMLPSSIIIRRLIKTSILGRYL